VALKVFGEDLDKLERLSKQARFIIAAVQTHQKLNAKVPVSW
jgi:hypothetical protein